MKKLRLFIALCMLASAANSQTNTFPSTGNVGIGTLSPNSSSALDIVSTSQGVLIPRMTRAQRDAIVSPATGLLIFQTNFTSGLYYYTGTGWSAVSTKDANKTLSNLISPTAVNADLIPANSGTLNLGSSSIPWNELHANSILMQGAVTMHSSGTGNFFAGADAGNLTTYGTDNTGIGVSALDTLSGGNRNTAIGREALGLNNFGDENTALGYRALYSNDFGIGNIAIGISAQLSNTTGGSNIAIGEHALSSNTTGSHLIAIGDSALYNQGNNSFDSYDNIAIGHQAMFTNDYGYLNNAVGGMALYSNEIGHNNAAFGYQTLYNNINGSQNVAIGNGALYDMDYGDYNSAVGGDALANANSVTGNYNSALGYRALYQSTTSDSNTACGAYAGYTITSGANNTFLGADADASAGTLSNASAIGYGATVTASNNMVFGNTAVTGWGFGVAPGTRAIKVGSSSSNGNGAYLTTGGTWTNTSAREKKEDIQKQDPRLILEKINQLEVTKWKYKGTDNEYHYGPMADDFHRLFDVGDDSSISDLDKTGVLFLGLQALNEQNEKLRSENADLKTRLEKIETMLLIGLDATWNEEQKQQTVILAGGAYLQQNVPNPFDGTTVIRYFVPEENAKVQMQFTSINGEVLQSVDLAPGKGSVTVKASELPAGTYQYSLLVNGKVMGAKQMVLNR